MDELAVLETDLDAAYAALATKAERAAVLHAQILSWYDHSDASTSFVAEGEKAAYTVSARSLKNTINYPAVIKTLGAPKFMALATITLDKLKKAAGEKYALCVTSSRTGSRSLTRVGD